MLWRIWQPIVKGSCRNWTLVRLFLETRGRLKERLYAGFCTRNFKVLVLTVPKDIWLTPEDGLHMTVLVVALHLSADELDSLMPRVKPLLENMSKFLADHQTRLVKPAIFFSDSGVVLSYVPCAGEIADDQGAGDDYTFLHLQQDLFELCREHGIDMSAQKNAGSCYVTLGRFINGENRGENRGPEARPDAAAMARWLAGIEKINETLRREYWPCEGAAPAAGNWILGRDGFDIRKGRSWYGGGQSVPF